MLNEISFSEIFKKFDEFYNGINTIKITIKNKMNFFKLRSRCYLKRNSFEDKEILFSRYSK